MNLHRPTSYRVIHKSLRDFRHLRYGSRNGNAEGERVNRGRGTPSFCPTLQVLDMSTLGDGADVNPVIKFLPHTAVLGYVFIYVRIKYYYTIPCAYLTTGGKFRP